MRFTSACTCQVGARLLQGRGVVCSAVPARCSHACVRVPCRGGTSDEDGAPKRRAAGKGGRKAPGAKKGKAGQAGKGKARKTGSARGGAGKAGGGGGAKKRAAGGGGGGGGGNKRSRA